ncbi:hypothetical protein [Mucilaginibacter sp.]|uniref:hypothetical protein n=1 Tax=Mucilaginibacter sp. TaxID=1882438 RepID=UPI00284B0B4A|nr:hypothetical protein [Mucilaginibacter sp.]MDR3696768.1 hypothetical protein [Mucilaginibacter sp.]
MSIIEFFYWLLLLIVSGVGIMRYKKLTLPFKILSCSVLIVFFFNILAKVFSFRYKNNAPILQTESITEYVIYALIYFYLFKNKAIKKVIFASIVILFVFFIINAIFLQPFLKVFPTNIYLPTQILFAIFSLLLFKQMLLYPSKVNIVKQGVFWYNTAMFIYATTMFLNLGLANYYVAHHINDYSLYYFWYFSLYLFHVFIGVSLLTDNKEMLTTYA